MRERTTRTLDAMMTTSGKRETSPLADEDQDQDLERRERSVAGEYEKRGEKRGRRGRAEA